MIGNPPYVSAVSMARNEIEKKYYKQKYPEATGSYDLYVLFLLNTLNLISKTGIYTWIIPNKFLIADYASDTKDKLIANGLSFSVDVSSFNVFENASVYPIIIFGNRNSKKSFKELLLESYNCLELRLFKEPIKLREHQTFTDFGIKFCSGATGFEAQTLKKYLVEKPNNISIPFTVSGCIDRYSYSNNNVRFMGMKLESAYINHSDEIAKSKWNFWNKSKILIAGMTKVIESVYVKEPIGLGVGVYAIYDWGSYKPLYISALLNSRYLSYFINIKFKDKHLAGGYLAINKSTLEKLPFIEPTATIEKEIVNLVEKILSLKQQREDTSTLESEIDLMVYKLYNLTYDEVKNIEPDFKLTKQDYNNFTFQ